MPATIQPILVTADLDRLFAFYTGLFGASEATRYPPDGPVFYLQLRVGNCELGLVTEGPDAVPGTSQRFALSVDVADVAAVLEQVEALGGRVQGPPNDMPWGQRVVHIEDPDGNALNLSQRLDA